MSLIFPSLTLPEAGNIDLWHIMTSDLMQALPAFRLLLNGEETLRASRFQFPAHQERFIIAHGMLRKILGNYTGIPAKKLVFGTHPHAKPCLLQDTHSLQFNLSHSGDRVLIAIATITSVGVDIEKIRPDIDLRLAARFFSPEENALLQKLPEAEKTRAFFRLWTGKEAILKMTGKGLTGSLASFSLDPALDQQTVSLESGLNCHLRHIPLTPDYASAVAASDKIIQLHQQNFIIN